MIFAFGDTYDSLPPLPPCRCVRCGVSLPPVHALDHLCAHCFDKYTERIIKEIADELEEVLNGKQEDK
jgi:hypothetical protein